MGQSLRLELASRVLSRVLSRVPCHRLRMLSRLLSYLLSYLLSTCRLHALHDEWLVYHTQEVEKYRAQMTEMSEELDM